MKLFSRVCSCWWFIVLLGLGEASMHNAALSRLPTEFPTAEPTDEASVAPTPSPSAVEYDPHEDITTIKRRVTIIIFATLAVLIVLVVMMCAVVFRKRLKSWCKKLRGDTSEPTIVKVLPPLSVELARTTPIVSPIVLGPLTKYISSQHSLMEVAVNFDGKKPINLFSDDYTPPCSCRECMLSDVPRILKGIGEIKAMLKPCEELVRSKQKCPDENRTILTDDQALAVASYTYDNHSGRLVKLYVVLNEVLRERCNDKLTALRPYLFYLITGMSALPTFQGEVYRGIPNEHKDLVAKNFVKGRLIQWSGFTSTSTCIEQAQNFAHGPEGIIFRITVKNGRSVQEYSLFPNENEVVLLPDSRLVVDKSMYQSEINGFWYVDLIESDDMYIF
jgi:hypothetical protein